MPYRPLALYDGRDAVARSRSWRMRSRYLFIYYKLDYKVASLGWTSGACEVDFAGSRDAGFVLELGNFYVQWGKAGGYGSSASTGSRAVAAPARKTVVTGPKDFQFASASGVAGYAP